MKKITRQDILKTLTEVSNQVNWESETHLISERVIDSLMLVCAVEMLSETYGVEFDYETITSEKFDSLDAITETVNGLL